MGEALLTSAGLTYCYHIGADYHLGCFSSFQCSLILQQASHMEVQGFKSLRVEAIGSLESLAQNWHGVTSATFYFSKQVTRSAQIQGVGK